MLLINILLPLEVGPGESLLVDLNNPQFHLFHDIRLVLDILLPDHQGPVLGISHPDAPGSE